MNTGKKTVWIALGVLFIAIMLSRLPALFSEIHSYPGDTVRWAAPAINYANYGVEHSYLPLIDQGDYGYMTAKTYYRWPLPPFYFYGLWASVTSDNTLALRLAPLALNLATTFYFFLIASLIFRRTESALLSTVLFSFIPGHFFLSVQISDTQFWILTLVGGIYHRFMYEQTGLSKHMAAHLGLLSLGCFSSWFGYLTVAAHFSLNIWSDVFSGEEKSRLVAVRGLLNHYRRALLLIAVISMGLQLGILYWLAGDAAVGNMSRRFSLWVTGLTDQNQDIDIVQRFLSQWTVLLKMAVGSHLPRLFGWPLFIVFLATPVVVVSLFDRVKRLVYWDRLIRLLVIHSFVLIGYLIIFTTHASHDAHTFSYQQLSPIVAICTVLTIAVVTGIKFSGWLQLATTLACCMFLVIPKFVDHYHVSALTKQERAIESARTFGETVKKNSLVSDFVLTNASDPRRLPGRVARYTARRTFAFDKNEWAEISPYLKDEAIKGLVFLHWHGTQWENQLDKVTLDELTSRATLVSETRELRTYRLK